MKNMDGRRPLSFSAVARAERYRNAKARQALGLTSQGEWGLALSGGGIRSATFCLGVLQWLIRNKRIADFDYLSTVSGGGYIGGWLTALIYRFGSLERLQAWQLEAAVAHLRRYSNYLTPHAGLLSLDTLAGVAIYVRNLLLNAVMLIAVLSAVLYAPLLLSALSAWLVGIGHHIAASLAAGLFFWIAWWVGYAGPSRTPPGSRMRRERFAGPAIVIPLLLAFLLLAHGMIALRHETGSMSPAAALWMFVWTGSVSYGALSLLAYLAWKKASFGSFRVSREDMQAQRKRELLDSPAAASDTVYLQHALFTVLAGSLGGVMLWVIYQYAACWLTAPPSPGAAGEPWQCNAVSLARLLRTLGQTDRSESHVGVALLIAPAMYFAGFCTLAVHVAVCRRLLTEHDREWGARWIANGGRLIGLWWGACLLAVAAPTLVRTLGAIGWGGLLAWLGASSLTARLANSFSATAAAGGSDWLRRVIYAIGPYVFVAGALVLVARLNFAVGAALAGVEPSLILDDRLAWPAVFLLQLGEDLAVWRLGTATLAPLLGAPILLAFLVGFAVDVNLFSFQSFYRNRLTRCYLGAAHFVGAERVDCEHWRGLGGRSPHSPTDLDPEDDLRLADLAAVRPYPIINTALNLNVSNEMAWQHRKAASFAFTPLACGFQLPLHFDACAGHAIFRPPQVAAHVAGGYRPTRRYLYDGVDGPKLGLPIAVSGAAFTSNAGFRTTPWMTFLLTVFGVRLGIWCSNPGLPEVWRHASPLNSLRLLVDEMLGRTSEARRYVYLSDGGHFENLGIYELVRRRCVRIVAVDASADPTFAFDDLANAIHKCRVDFGAEISFARGSLEKLQRDASSGLSAAAAAVGKVHFADGTSASLIYVKPALTGTEPRDILYYKSQHPDFPHETTLDQWFSESQFESYRKLGEHVADEALSGVLKKRS